MKDSFMALFKNEFSYFKRLIFRKKILIKDNRKRLNELYQLIDFKEFQKRDLIKRHLPQLLKYEDKNSMRNSIETRLPFVDYKFVASAISINDTLKFKKGYLKYLLRKIVEDILPNEIVWRKNKFGFEAPEEMWIKQSKTMMINQIQKSDILKALISKKDNFYNNNSMLWKMYNISIWEEVYNVKFEKKENV
jgi:asparagine synthase (glutamine-hydrolysing)